MKYHDWYSSLPEHTKAWLKKQPLWHDRDLLIAAGIGILIGFILGLAL